MNRPSLYDLGPGSTFAGRFRVIEKLGQGGMGAVYRVEQTATGRQRALKVMHPEFSRDARFRERFAAEALVSARIQSPHAVEVSDAGIDDATGTPWITMELLQGRELNALLADGRHVPPAEAWAILAQLGDALAAAHDAGVLHLDLKPANLFLNDATPGARTPTLKVLDFGIARVLAEGRTSTEVTTAAGSPLWMAPEQTASGDRVRASSDVWAVGLLVFRMLTGALYWRAAHASPVKVAALLREVLYAPIAPASERAAELGVAQRLPPDFDPWFRRCVEREPDARFQHARAAFTSLRGVLLAAGRIADTVMLTEVPRPPVDVTAVTAPSGPPRDPVRDTSPAEVWATRGECDLQLGRWHDAVADFSAAIERAPSVGSYWYGRARALAALGQHAVARTDMLQAAALGHAEARAHVGSG
jgi:serine/threonine-protein kinase